MPHSDVHKRKRKKNYITVALIFGFCLIVYMMSIAKMAHSNGIPDKYKNAREAHQEAIEKEWENYEEQGKIHQEQIDAAEESWLHGDQMSDQAKEVQAVKDGTKLDWETDEDFQARKNAMTTKNKEETDENADTDMTKNTESATNQTTDE